MRKQVRCGFVRPAFLELYGGRAIPVTDRNSYVNALENASVGEDIAPFANFLAGLVRNG
jgi:hypothetical protein